MVSRPDTAGLSLDSLNPEQREAVLHTDGPLLIIAGAGSGKTRVLTHRVAHLIDQELADPTQILAITFTNRAATEMKERVQGLVGGHVAARMWVMTFHSACGRMLRADAARLGYRSTLHDLRRPRPDPAGEAAASRSSSSIPSGSRRGRCTGRSRRPRTGC